jgi:hypothetical protein
MWVMFLADQKQIPRLVCLEMGVVEVRTWNVS